MKTTFLLTMSLALHLIVPAQIIPTEIMYNAPGTGGNDLEFIELYNAGTETLALDGYQLLDAGNFTFIFPSMNIDPGSTVLIATNKDVADIFYGTTFLDIAGAGNFLGNGGEQIQLLDNFSQVVFSVIYDDVSPWVTAPDGGGPSLELLNSSYNPAAGGSWTAATSLVGVNGGFNIYASPGTFTSIATPFVSFQNNFIVVNENDGSASVTIELNTAGSEESSVTLSLGNFATASESDFEFEETLVTFDALTQTNATINIPIINNGEETVDRLFTLTISNPVNCDLGDVTEFVVYILDDEETVPVATEQLEIEFLGSYLVDAEGSAEIVAYNKARKRLYVMNSTGITLEIIDFSDPHNPVTINSIDLTSFGSAGTSVACNNKYVAVTVDGEEGEPGSVVIFSLNGVFRNQLAVGYLPDMLTFTPNNRFLVIANEGEPSDEYTFDPEGSISVVYMLGNVAALDDDDVIHIDFNDFDSQLEDLRSAGVRIFGMNSSVSQDLEPEFVSISGNSQTAWVTLQENNAIAKINLQTFQVEEIFPLGLKDHSLAINTLDVSDQSDEVVMATWENLKGMYLPDAIASYKIGGTTYLVTANEGDQREYGVIDEDVSVGSAGYLLDPTIFPDAQTIKANHLLGRLKVTPYSGDTDNDGDFDEIHVFGSRSFSIWNGNTGELVYDSGNDFETITANDPTFGSLFNASNNNNSFKNRSDNKGPEPEGVAIANINETYYAFITLERNGGMLVYDITNPTAPVFEAYRNSRTLGSVGGDLGPEGIIYIDAQSSPNDTALVVIANEISSTLSIYSLNQITDAELRSDDAIAQQNSGLEADAELTSQIKIYPNPASTEKVYLSEPVSFNMYNSEGLWIMSGLSKAIINVEALTPGLYVLVAADGRKAKLVIQ